LILELDGESVELIQVDKDRSQWKALADMSMQFGFHEAGEFHGQFRGHQFLR
jgi:hypothetical protein